MSAKRGDVVLVDMPFASGAGGKWRPVLVVQNDRDNVRLLNTIVAQITTVTHRRAEPTQLLIEVATPDCQRSGLKFDSVVNCANLSTVEQARLGRKLGELSDAQMRQVADCLKAALELP